MLKKVSYIIFIFTVVFFCRDTFAAFSYVEEFFLPNGLQVVVIPNHKAPIVQQIILYKAGSIDEPKGKGGIAHLLEHLMFRGTHKFKDGQFDKLIEFNGGKSNAATSQNYTYYYQLLNIKALELAMYLEADRMYGLKINNDLFKSERDVVFQERKQRMNSDSTSRFWEQYNKLFWGECPYGESISGTANEIKDISITDIKDFYKKFYAPNNAILILSGDIDKATIKHLTEKYFGSIKSQTLESNNNLAVCEIPKQKEKTITINNKQQGISVSRITAQYMFPHFSGEDKNLYAIILASAYLGDGVNSILYKDIIDINKLASSVDTNFFFLTRGNSVFSFSAYFNDVSCLSKIKKLYYKALSVAYKNITDKRLSELKEKTLSGIVYNQDNPSKTALIVAQWLGAGYSLDDLKSFENNINNVTLQDVRNALKSIKDTDHIWGEVVPYGRTNED